MRTHLALGIGLCAGVIWAACGADHSIPGNETLGDFQFAAAPLSDDCALSEIDGGFGFEGVFSRLQDAGTAWFSVSGTSRQGTFDGQRFVSTAPSSRRFSACECAQVEVVETMEVALLSESQDQALGSACPADVDAFLSSGPPVNPDGGIVPPGSRPEGFDALRACGRLVDEVRPQSCGCQPCTVRYRLEGVRKR